MTLPGIFIWAGTGLAILGLLGLGYCIVRALSIRRGNNPTGGQAEMQTLVAVNVASVGIASIGLCCVIIGIIL